MYKIEDIINKVHQADCLEFMKQMPDKCVDLVLTDPPYGVGWNYDTYDDTPENLKKMIDKVMPEILRVSKRVLITTGHTNLFIYPKPKWILAWFIKSGAGMNSWGFTTWQPILAYGNDPYLENKLGLRPDSIEHIETTEKWLKEEHSCPKPIKFWKKLLLRGSVKETDIIFDPFNGSGTTTKAAQDLNRRFIGIDISEKYCEIARQRLRQQTLL